MPSSTVDPISYQMQSQPISISETISRSASAPGDGECGLIKTMPSLIYAILFMAMNGGGIRRVHAPFHMRVRAPARTVRNRPSHPGPASLVLGSGTSPRSGRRRQSEGNRRHCPAELSHRISACRAFSLFGINSKWPHEDSNLGTHLHQGCRLSHLSNFSPPFIST